MTNNVEISNVIDDIFDIINKIDSSKNISPEQNDLLDNYKQKYSSTIYTSCVSNYYKIKINSLGENVSYDIFLDQIIYFMKNIKTKTELFTKDINLFNIIIDLIFNVVYEKIIITNIKNLSGRKSVLNYIKIT